MRLQIKNLQKTDSSKCSNSDSKSTLCIFNLPDHSLSLGIQIHIRKRKRRKKSMRKIRNIRIRPLYRIVYLASFLTWYCIPRLHYWLSGVTIQCKEGAKVYNFYVRAFCSLPYPLPLLLQPPPILLPVPPMLPPPPLPLPPPIPLTLPLPLSYIIAMTYVLLD